MSRTWCSRLTPDGFRLFSTPLYKRLLASRGAMQEVIIGSRPASRKKATAIENLRAIPRVFSWAQCRLMLPGRYGSAVSACLEPGNAWPSQERHRSRQIVLLWLVAGKASLNIARMGV